ncbi:MAG: exodeoxyribonuclease VII large subunit [bacterium]|nr:exodeoxyribonuclease VII large subunit [bacterium]
MSGTVELDPNGTHLLIRFPYREDLVALVKELPGRRWDPRNKTWKVPAAQIERVYATFATHLFEFAPEASGLLAGTLGTAPSGDDDDGADDSDGNGDAKAKTGKGKPGQLPLGLDDDAPPEAMTISALNRKVQGGVRDLFPDTFWVIGEVVGYDKTAEREHRFFQLAEKGQRQARAVATVETALFGRTASWLLPKLAEGQAPLTLRDGIEIRALVRADFYPAAGRFQVIVEGIDPTHTLGKLALTREQILAELREAGLLHKNRGLPFPVPATRIGVLASPDSDGFHDFCQQLEKSGCGFDVTLVPIKTQGVGLKPSLMQGLAWFAERSPQFDVLCVLRGGGSRTDLAWFDDREIALAVAKHPLKVLVGIGHQRDQSVLDAIAHSEKTPTAVAALLVECLRGVRADVHDRATRLRDAVADLLADLRTDFRDSAERLQRAAIYRVRDQRHALHGSGRELEAAVTLRLANERNRLTAAATRVRTGSDRTLERAAMQLESRSQRHRLLDPRRVLERGYALARDASGKVLPDAESLAPDSKLVVQFRDGRVTTRVEDVQRESP